MPKLVMTQASCRVTVHFIAAAQRLGQATVIIDEHAGQRIEQIRGEFRPLGLGKIEGERLNFGERGQERDHTRISPPIKNAVPHFFASGCCAGTVQPRSLRRGTRRRRAPLIAPAIRSDLRGACAERHNPWMFTAMPPPTMWFACRALPGGWVHKPFAARAGARAGTLIHPQQFELVDEEGLDC